MLIRLCRGMRVIGGGTGEVRNVGVEGVLAVRDACGHGFTLIKY